MWHFSQGVFLQNHETQILDDGFFGSLSRKSSVIIFETLRTYDGEFYFLDKYFSRFFSSHKILCKSLRSPVSEIKNKLLILRDKNLTLDASTDLKYRIVSIENNWGIFCSPLPRSFGIDISVNHQTYQRSFPQAKYYDGILYDVIPSQRPSQYQETLLIDNSGFLRESTMGNIFVICGKTILTPAKSILFGITRSIILDIAQSLNFSISEQEISYEQLLTAAEIGLTSSLKGIVSVRQISNIWQSQQDIVIPKLKTEFQKYITQSKKSI